MTSSDTPRCQNTACGREITVMSGHRARQYCDDTCKQAAYLARKDAAKRARIAAEEAEKLRLEMDVLHQRWGNLLPETLLQFKALKDRAGMATADQVVATLKKEVAQQQQYGADLKEEQAKYAALLADYMQAGKKIANMEREIQRIERLKIVKSREAMLHELMLLGGRLTYCSMTDLGIDEGIDAWLNYVRGASDEQLTIAIAQGFYQADRLAMAAIEASDLQQGVKMRRRIDDLERDIALRDERIAELEWGRGREAGDALYREQIERQEQQIEDLEREVNQRITEIGRIKEAHGSTMYGMNTLLAAAQTAQREDGAETQRIAELEHEVEHLNKRISKQYERRILKQQARIEELEREKVPANSDRATMAARLMAVAERLHHCRLLIPHINPGVESWQSFIETASTEQLREAIEYAEHYYGNLMYLDELDQKMRKEAHQKKVS